MTEHILRDEWRMVEVARTKAYAPPTTPIDDITGECVCIRLNALWTPFLTGVLSLLTNPNLWEHTDPEYAPQEIIKLIEALDGGATLPCAGIEDIRFLDGVIEVLSDGVWTPVAGTENIVTGIGFVSGGLEVQQGGEYAPVSGDCADPCNQYPDTPSFDKSGAERSCAIATSLTEWWFEKLQDSLDQAEAAADTIAAIDSILAVFPPAYIVADQIDDAWNEWVEAGIQIVRALDTVEEREAFAEALYCHLRANADEFTENIWQDFRDEYIANMPPLLVFYDWFQNGAVVDRAHRASYAGGDGCGGFPCETQTYIDHFTTSDFNSLTLLTIAGIAGYYGIAGQWSDSNGKTDAGSLVSTTSGEFPSNPSITVYVDLGAEKRAEYVGLWTKASRANQSTGINVAFFDEAKQLLATYPINTTGSTTTDYQQFEWNGSMDNVRYVRFGVVVEDTNPDTHPIWLDEIQVQYRDMP